jgi:soluble lytic murein transglycosylase-like protein
MANKIIAQSKKQESGGFFDVVRNLLSGLFGGEKTINFGAPPPEINTSGMFSRTPLYPQASPEINYKITDPVATPLPHKGAEPYIETIRSASKERGVPEEIFYRLLARESMGFNPNVISGKLNSPVGARGIAQFMPDTAKWWQNTHGQFDPLNPEQAIPASAHYLQYLHDQFGDWKNTVAAYNAGEGAVRQYGGVPPYKETQDYVNAILQGKSY